MWTGQRALLVIVTDIWNMRENPFFDSNLDEGSQHRRYQLS